MLIDTHSHIYSEEFNNERNETIGRSLDVGVKKIMLPNVDSSTIRLMLDLADQFPEICYPMIGIHPTSVKEDYKEELELMEYWLGKRTFYGIGEIGIDLYWDKSYFIEQVFVFRKQLDIASEMGLPVSIHTRDSFVEVVEIVKEKYVGKLKGVFHCFSGTLDQAKEVVEMGFKIGVGGTVTFKNSGVDKVISGLSPTDIVLETDSPYLAPTPFRGKRNESSYLPIIVKKVAEIFSTSETQISSITTKNAFALFNVI